jgi:hypothetical protein
MPFSKTLARGKRQPDWTIDNGLSHARTTGNTCFPRVSRGPNEVKALGLEPRTYGLKVRCSTD